MAAFYVLNKHLQQILAHMADFAAEVMLFITR